MKKVLLIVGAILGLILVIAIMFFLRFKQMVRTIDNEQLSDIDLSWIDDRIYTGEYGEFLVYAKVAVTIEDHAITKIAIIDQRAGPGYEAVETIERILEAQSPDVDAVSGATGSSKCIMIAVRNALAKQE